MMGGNENSRDRAADAFDELDSAVTENRNARSAASVSNQANEISGYGNRALTRVHGAAVGIEKKASCPSADLWPTKDRKIKVGGNPVDSFEDFEKLDIGNQTVYIEHLPPDQQSAILSLIEGNRSEVIRKSLEIEDPFEQLDYWKAWNDNVRGGKVNLPSNIWK